MRDLQSGEVGYLYVKWEVGKRSTDCCSYYNTVSPRKGSRLSDPGNAKSGYTQTTFHVEYQAYESEIRYCTYLGRNLCKDLKTGMIYRPEIKEAVQAELNQIAGGEVVSVCCYKDKVYFGGTYRSQKLVALYERDKEGVPCWFDASNYKYLKLDHVYTEEGVRFVDASLALGNYYAVNYVNSLDPQYNKMYQLGHADTYGTLETPFAMVIPAQGEIKYGMLKAATNEAGGFKGVEFIPLHKDSSYEVNKEQFDQETRKILLETAIPMKARVFELDKKLAIPEGKPLEVQMLNYIFQVDDHAICVDLDTWENVELPLADLPAEITEGCVFEYYPEISYCVLADRKEEENEPAGESITTYEGYDSVKKVHVIRTVDGDGDISEYTYEDSDIEFTEPGIRKGMRIQLKLSFNDDTCCLNAHVSKYTG